MSTGRIDGIQGNNYYKPVEAIPGFDGGFRGGFAEQMQRGGMSKSDQDIADAKRFFNSGSPIYREKSFDRSY